MWRDPWRYTSRIFEDADREFEEAEEMLNRMFRTVREGSPAAAATSRLPYYYGYQINIGADGKPHIREFGNVKPAAKGLIEQSGVREPLVDTSIDEKNNQLTITAEMPGVSREDIKVNISDTYVTIQAERGDKKYHTDVPIDLAVEDVSAKAIYSNGILELKIKLKQAPKPKGKEVKIE
jgi:HSP20 family protein